MLLRVRHRSALKPAVEHLVNSPEHGSRVLLTWDGDFIHHVLVQVRHPHPAQFGQLVNAADANHLVHALAAPDGDGRAPEPVPADGPVPGVGQPTVEPPLLDGVGDPVRLLVVFDDAVADLLDLDEPGRNCLVDERRVGPPAEWVRVVKVGFLNKPAGVLDQLH